MKRLLFVSLLAGSLSACGNDSATQQIRDNETPVVAKDQVDDHMVKPDTLMVDSTRIR